MLWKRSSKCWRRPRISRPTSPDLDKQKLQSAVVRKAIGQAYIQQKRSRSGHPAIATCGQLQPGDAETLQLLITCYDKIGDAEGTIRQLLQAVDCLAPRY